MAEFEHTTVLLHEAVAALKIDPAGIYVDCTLGGGGHSREILKQLGPTGHLFSFDQDQTAIDYNQTNLASYLAAGQLTFIKSNFANLKAELAARGITHVDGVVYDLGVSSPQFDNAARGFSYQHDAPLDMRMDQSQALSAQTVVNTWPYADLVRIFTATVKKSSPSRSPAPLSGNANGNQSRRLANWLRLLRLRFQPGLVGRGPSC